VSTYTFSDTWLVGGSNPELFLTNAQVDALLLLPFTDDVTFIAVYDGDVFHTVTFYWNYPSNTTAFIAKSVSDGNPVPVPNPAPSRTGFTFQGWQTAPTGNNPFAFTTPTTGNLSLYARWTSNSGGGNGNGGTQPPPPGPIHHAYLIGLPDGTIRPHANISRAEVATIFFRLMSDAGRASYWLQTNTYPDVVLNHWFNNAVSTTTNAGLFQGVPDGTFQPTRAITRAEFATVIARLMSASYNGAPLFNDISGHWAERYINAVAHYNWAWGADGLGGPFRPDDLITRAETAAIVNRVVDRLPEELDDLLPGMRTWPDNANTTTWFYLYIQEATNSHHYVRKADGIHETWTQLLPPRDWAVLERPNSRPGDILG